MRAGWLELLRSLGGALLELLKAEAEALVGDLRSSGRRLSVAVLLLAIGGFVAFWACGVLSYALVELVALRLPRWSAALLVFGLLIVVALLLGVLARFKLRRLERPASTVRRRLTESLDWWDRRISEGEHEEPWPGGEE